MLQEGIHFVYEWKEKSNKTKAIERNKMEVLELEDSLERLNGRLEKNSAL